MKITPFEAFKKVRNRLRKHDASHIVSACISKLMNAKASEISHFRTYPPWVLLLLLKWTFLYGDFSPYDPRPLREDDLNKLVNLMHDLSGTLKSPSEYDHFFFFLRNLAFQQFWVQQAFSEPLVARQSLLFGHLDKNHPFNEQFIGETGISIGDFNILSMALLYRFYIELDNYVTEQWFDSIKDSFSPGTIAAFLSALSRDQVAIQEYLRNTGNKAQSVPYEFYEESPLKRFPLIRSGDDYICYSRDLLFHSLQDFVYDFLREKNPAAFMEIFSGMFENYVRRALDYSRVPYVDERRLKDEIGQGKVVDFLLIDKETKIFLDAKAVEMARLGKISHLPEVVRDKTNDSLIKAIWQGYQTAQRLGGRDEIAGHHLNETENYLLVVTYKDFYVGNGQDFYQHIAREKPDAILQEHDGKKLIPFENMYFLSVVELDLLVQTIRGGIKDLTAALELASKSDQDAATKKSDFRSHISSFYPDGETPDYPDYLVKEFDEVYDALLKAFSHPYSLDSLPQEGKRLSSTH